MIHQTCTDVDCELVEIDEETLRLQQEAMIAYQAVVTAKRQFEVAARALREHQLGLQAEKAAA